MNRHYRIQVGLQSKAILIIAFVIVASMVAGGWFYLSTAQWLLKTADQQNARRLAHCLGVLCENELASGNTSNCKKLVKQFVRNRDLKYVALLDPAGQLVASAADNGDESRWKWVERPVTVASIEYLPGDILYLAQPIVSTSREGQTGKLLGAVRLVQSMRQTAVKLSKAQEQLWIIAAAIVVGAIPLGYMLVWRVILQPLRRLVFVTRSIASGNLSERTHLHRNDEMGKLASAFDAMADQIDATQKELIKANEDIEKKVVEWTSQLEVANRRLKEEIAEKEDFLRAVSHDLNAPLQNIAGMSTMILVKWRDKLPADAINRLERIKANVDNETSMISELLELSRIRSRPQKRDAVDVGKMVAELVGDFEDTLKNRNIELSATDDMPTIWVERNRLRKVFQNLIDNAIKYMHREEGGRIEIGYRRSSDCHEFRVSDNGPGIQPEDQQKIFCIFRRAITAEAMGVGGKGVGLALVKAVVSNYEGRAWVESQAGQGATFYFTLSASATIVPAESSKKSTPAVLPSGVFRLPGDNCLQSNDTGDKAFLREQE
jgi:signal transduction histidine kinase